MELAIVSAALFGMGIAYSKVVPASLGSMASGDFTRKQPNEPDAANNKAGLHASARARTPSSIIPVDNNPPGVISGRRDNSLFADAPSQYEQQMDRIYGPAAGSKREVEKSIDVHTKSDNVLVRSNIGYQSKFFKELEKPRRMHNVNPVATTTGTASQLVGPGVAAGMKETGDHGLHYGMVRMRPSVVQNTFREQKGGVITGKSSIDARPADISLAKHAPAAFGLGTSGHENTVTSERLKFHAISQEYLTSAPGRASVTGLPGAAGTRLEPVVSATNRGSDNVHQGVAGVSSIQATDDRTAYREYGIVTDREHRNEHLGPAIGAMSAAHPNVASNFHIPSEERGTTEQQLGLHRLNVSNPGQQMMLPSAQTLPITQRGTSTTGSYANVTMQMPSAAMQAQDGSYAAQKSTNRLTNDYRPGAAILADTPIWGGQIQQKDAYDTSRLTQSTQRELQQTMDYKAPAKSVGVNAPMSYGDILQSEGYSNKNICDKPPSTTPAPLLGLNQHGSTETMGRFEYRPPLPNASRHAAGGIQNQAGTNLYVNNTKLDVNPNRVERLNTRLDTRILDALAKNELRTV